MDVWSVINPLLKLVFYFAVFGAVGTILFMLHFQRYISSENTAYCARIIKISITTGTITSAATLLFISGNMGGDLISIFDPNMLQLAFGSKLSIAASMSLLGFIFMYTWSVIQTFLRRFLTGLGACLILLSFIVIGHSTKYGFLTQILVIIHLVGISYWVGSLMSLRKLCISPQEKNLLIITHRFGVYAIGYITALVIAGTLFAYNLLNSFSALTTTVYGNVLLTKVCLVSLLLSLGALNKFRLLPFLRTNERAGAKNFTFPYNLKSYSSF